MYFHAYRVRGTRENIFGKYCIYCIFCIQDTLKTAKIVNFWGISK